MYQALELLRFDMVALVPIACEEFSHVGVLGQMRRCSSHHGGCTGRVADAWAHMGWAMVHGCMELSVDIQWCMRLCHGVQGYVVECWGVYLCVAEHDDAQQFIEVFFPEISLDEGIRISIGFGTLKFEERVDHRVNCELRFITHQHCTLMSGTLIPFLYALTMSNRTQEVHLRQLDGA